MAVGKNHSMSQPIEKNIFERLLNVGETSEASILLRIAKEVFGDDLQKLLNNKVLIHLRNLKEIEVMDGDNEDIAEVQRRDGKNMYFSSSDGWVAVMDEDIELYKINFDWIIKQVMNALDIESRHNPKVILEDNIWALGQHRIDKQKIHLVIARNFKNNAVLDSLNNYLNSYHKARNPALVVSLDQHLPTHLVLPHQNELVRIDEAMVWDSDSFELNTHLLSGKMGGTITKPGFSNSYRTLISNGKTYEFTPKQSEALEFMDNESKPIHQTEILSHTTSHQGTKLRELFKGKGGKVHDAWNVIIKSDRKGNYWLEY